ncbi:DrmB family protein [Nocardia sp. bgisy118]|uniref:DrmB family protein n=1 Tax=Nocardia sp. bgisy118 TaxID=3413786 RepID=UPI003F49BC1A
MERIKHDLRLSETITPFGVGAIADVRGESIIASDTSWWDRRSAPEISCERLLSRLGPGELRQPPAHAGRSAKDTAALLYWRFPAWRFCERCSKLSRYSERNKGRWSNSCACGGVLVPMRYVAICEGGSHVQDINWFQWAHRGHDEGVTDEVRFCRAYKELLFVRSRKHGEGLASLRVTCGGCNRARSLAELVGAGSLRRDGIRCEGRQPWQDRDFVEQPCEHPLFAVQRGATGNYIAERVSALDIPEARPQSKELEDRVRGHVLFERVEGDNGGPQADLVAGWIAEELGIDKEMVLALANQKTTEEDESLVLDLKDGEWSAFLGKLGTRRDCSESNFVVDGWPVDSTMSGNQALAACISGIGQVRRVREVRALRGFRRYNAQAERIPADLGPDRKRRPIFPALELFGEGFFIRFDEDRIAEWESDTRVQQRAGLLLTRRRELQWAHRLDEPEPRYIALHTIAHLLIRRLAFASGYSSASLQERIYANSSRPDRTAGILIYTAAGDAQGTLGGLVRLGEPGRLIPLMLAALDDGDVCSNDPVCIESDRQGTSLLNLSACHGCTLVSETSCESGNRLLDRQLVYGGSKTPGLLEAVLPELRSTVGAK